MSAMEAAWSDFWRAGGRGAGSGCVPSGLHGIDAVQRAVWADAVRPLRKNASVLDLATGDGAVLVKMRAARPDLKLTGVDSAVALPGAPSGTQLKAGVRMERLPFPAGRFDLVSSQFGIEYGDVGATATEVARVLRPGGAFAFLVHHAGGPIVAHNRARSAALAWVVRESGLLERARGFVRLRSGGRLPVPQGFSEAVAEGGTRFPEQSVAAEFAEAVRRTLVMSSGESPARTLSVLDELAAKAANELARVASLMGAARSADGIASITTAFRAVGLAISEPTTASEGTGRLPFGWVLRGRR